MMVENYTNKIIQGNTLDVIKQLPDESIDAIVTDPPYELGFMGKKWDKQGIAYNVDLWKECFRVLKPGAHLISFGGTRTYHRMACAIEDAGFEIRDMLEWIYANGFPKGLNVGKAYDKKMGNEREVIAERNVPDITGDAFGTMNEKQGGSYKSRIHKNTKGTSQWEGFGTALKPAHEPIVLARKPLSEKTIVENCIKHGTGALDIDGCRIPTSEGLNGGAYSNNREISTNKVYGQYQRIEEEFEQPQGRFPANLCVTDDALNDGKITKGSVGRANRKSAGKYSASSYKMGIITKTETFDIGSKSRYFDINQWKRKNLEKTIKKNGRYYYQKICEMCGKTFLSDGKPQQRFCSSKCYGEYVKVYGIKKGNQNGRKWYYNQNYFNKIDTPEKAYWVGFIVGDGWISDKDNKHRLQINLSTQDLEHLEKFVSDIGGNPDMIKFTTGKFDNDLCSVILTSKKLVEDLKKIGIPVKDKSFLVEKPNIPKELEQYFWRGVFDADGCVTVYYRNFKGKYRYKMLTIKLTGSQKICKQFSKYLGLNGMYVYSKSNIFEFNMAKKDLIPKIYDKLYGLGGYSLKRKQEKFFEFLNDKIDYKVWAEKYGLIQCPKASKSERNAGCDKYGIDNNHPTVKPIHLMAWLVRLISKEGDFVLDPFIGSGTTAISCLRLNRRFIGIELNPEYVELASNRIKPYLSQKRLGGL